MAIRSAVESGHLEVAKFFHAQGFTGCNQETLRGAARGGHLAVVRWLWTQFHDDLKVELLCQDEFVTWMLPLTREMAALATNGHLEVVQYLYAIALALVGKKSKRGGSSRYPCKLEMDDVVIVDAARNGHLNVVQWICTDTTVSSIKEAISYAAGSGHFPVVKWLHENRPHEDFQSVVMDEAARYGDLSLVKWLHTNRPDEGWSPFGIDNAARGGYLHILRWLRDHEVLYEDSDYSLPMNAMQLAFMGGHFDALLFVHYEFKNWNSNRIMLEDYGFHNAHMKAWLQEELEVLSDAN